MSEAASGLASAVAAAVDEAGPVMFTPAEQIDLALGGDLPTQVNLQAAATVARRGRGRPPGSRNRKTEELRTYLLTRYRHPLETLMAIQAQDPDILAAELGCKPVEAAALIKSAAAEATPYFEGKAAVRVELDARGHMTLVLGGAPGVVPGQPIAADVIEQLPGGLVFGPPPEVTENAAISPERDEVSE